VTAEGFASKRPSAMSAFEYRSQKLCCEDTPADIIAERFGTPTYVYSRTAILDNFDRLRRGLQGISPLICYSVKANSNLRILKLLAEAGAGFDIVSGGELARVRAAGADLSRVVYSGVGKTQDEIDAGLAAGILMFNVESSGELELIEARARRLGIRAAISLRINPDVEAHTHPYISTGEVIHKFGVPKEEAIELYHRAAASPHLKILGAACHIGSQILEVAPFLEALDELLKLAETLRSVGIALEFLDLGGGWGIPYADEPPLDAQRLMREYVDRLTGSPCRLILEPGRALVADAGVLLARVLYVKRRPEKSFVVVDAGMNDLMRPALYGSHHEILPVVKRSGPSLRADVVGPLCETGDFLARDREMAEVEPGDLIAIMTAGAYGFVLSSNYNSRPRPAEVLVSGERAELIRSRERIEDLMAGEGN
jgi:diaminopimelate decarboxylase